MSSRRIAYALKQFPRISETFVAAALSELRPPSLVGLGRLLQATVSGTRCPRVELAHAHALFSTAAAPGSPISSE
jgi:hypothetical protein